VPQVVCYATPMPWLYGFLRRKLLKVKFVSLVNLIADAEVVPELVADTFSVQRLTQELSSLLGGSVRQQQLSGYQEVWHRLGKEKAPDNAARIIHRLLAG